MATASSSVGTSNVSSLRHPFERRVDELKPSKSDINTVIMDYLITEGYPTAAQKFALEANFVPPDAANICERVEIRNSIHRGDIENAIGMINDVNPQILDRDMSLHFALLRLQLIELIRKGIPSEDGDISVALSFATTQLAPRAPTNPEFLDDLEKTMALLIFPPENLTPPLAALLDPKLRQTIATRVNEAILHNQNMQREAKIRKLIRLRAWAEQKARDAKKPLPDRLPLGLECESRLGNENEDDTIHGDIEHHDPMIS